MVKRIWNFLGSLLPTVPARPEEKTVMKLKHWQEVNKECKLHKNVQFPLAAQVKKDGVYALILVESGGVHIFNRTGRKMTNVESLEAELQSALFPNGVYLAELCNSECSLEVLSGIVNPNRTKPLDAEQLALLPSLHLYLHDTMKVDEFIVGLTLNDYPRRHQLLSRNLMMCPPGRYTILPYWVMYNEQQVEEFAQECIDAGEEGAVFKPYVAWEAGHKGWRMMKWVREVNYDLLCVGIEEGTGKYKGKVANLLLKWEGGKTIKAMLGKGWTHKDAEEMFDGYMSMVQDGPPHPNNPYMRVYRVRGLSDSSKGVIRLPKVMEERHDKTTGDF